MTDTECSPSVSRLRRRTIRMSATRRLPATSAGVPMVAEYWLGILISLHNQGDAGHIGWRKRRAHDQQQDRGRDLRPGERRQAGHREASSESGAARPAESEKYQRSPATI